MMKLKKLPTDRFCVLHFTDKAMRKFIFILCVLIQFIYGYCNSLPWRTLYCPFTESNLIGSNLSDPFRIEYVTAGEYLIVTCCQKYYVNTTKQFYRRNRFFTNPERPLWRLSKELIYEITNIQEEQTGVYYCKDDFSDTNEFTFAYYIDVEYPNVPTISGKLKDYKNYKKTYIDPLNDYLSPSNQLQYPEDITVQVDDPLMLFDTSYYELKVLKKKTGLGLIAGMRWDPWSDCDFCAGKKTRKGRCHLEPVVIDEIRWARCEGLCEYYKNSLHMDCRSYWTLEQLFPTLANMTKDIPNFLSEAKCVGPCVSEVIPGYDYVKKLRTRIINVGDSAVLSCPGFSRKKNCYWRQNGVKLTSNEYDPYRQVSINELCMLYLNEVTKAENGNFTCFLNDQMIQQNTVRVDVLYSEVDEARWRHVLYLLYVIFLCFIILVGGIVIGCIQIGNFRKINAEEMIEMYSTRRMEYERLLPTE